MLLSCACLCCLQGGCHIIPSVWQRTQKQTLPQIKMSVQDISYIVLVSTVSKHCVDFLIQDLIILKSCKFFKGMHLNYANLLNLIFKYIMMTQATIVYLNLYLLDVFTRLLRLLSFIIPSTIPSSVHTMKNIGFNLKILARWPQGLPRWNDAKCSHSSFIRSHSSFMFEPLHSKTPHVVTVLWLDSDDVVDYPLTY